MRARLKARLRLAGYLRAHVTVWENLQREAAWAKDGCDAATSDPFVFRELFKEDMPPHLRHAVLLESRLWQSVLTWLQGVPKRWLTDEQFHEEPSL